MQCATTAGSVSVIVKVCFWKSPEYNVEKVFSGDGCFRNEQQNGDGGKNQTMANLKESEG